MVTFSTQWIINKHQHCSVQGKQSSIQLTFHVYFWPTAFNPFLNPFKTPFSSFSLKKKSSIKTFSIAHFRLRKYRKYYFTCNVHVRRCLAFALNRGSAVFQNKQQMEEEEEDEEEIQTDGRRHTEKIHACMHSVQRHANTIHHEK